jgi:hypothetical protein
LPDFIADLTENKVDSIIAIRARDTLLYHFSYDAAGKTVNFQTYKKAGLGWVNFDRETYTFYESGKLKTDLYETGEKNEWLPSRLNTYTYDANGFMATELKQDCDSTGWHNTLFTTYNNSSTGLLLLQLVQFWDGGAWVYSDRLENKYNAQGKLIQAKGETFQDGLWSLFFNNTYNYNQAGDIEEIIQEANSGSPAKQISRETYVYDDLRRLLKVQLDISKNSVWEPKTRDLYEYKSSELVNTITTENWDDTAWQKISYYVDSLNQNNLSFSYYFYSWRNGGWTPNSRQAYTYNTKGKLLSLREDAFFNSDWSTDYLEKNAYDQTGELLVSSNCQAWNYGSPYIYDKSVKLNIDINTSPYIYVMGHDINIWYKSATIPVELSSFSAQANNGFVLLKWQTATETNNEGFEVQRKSGGSGWLSVGFVQGNGTAAKPISYSFTDKNAPAEKSFYRLKQIDFNGSVKYSPEVEVSSAAVKSFSLLQNYPNPFNPSTVITYTIPSDSKVKLSVYNAAGQLVKELVNGVKEAGVYNIRFDAASLSSGVYFYSIEAGSVNGGDSYRNTKKLLLIK